MRYLTLSPLVLITLLSSLRPQDPGLPTTVAGLELEAGDTLVFLGDSITHQCLYTQYVEDFFYTRYPQQKIHFHNAGVSGDKAADALARFEEDVASYKPKYVTILLGMNDGSYTGFEPEIFARYEKGMTEILDRLRTIGSTAIPMTPTMFDSRAVVLRARGSNQRRDHYYNAVLAFYGAWLREQAQRRGLGFVDMYGPLNAHTIEQRKTDPKFTLIRDAVHPGADGQVVMASAILQDLRVERRTVSSINAVFQKDKWKVTGKGEIDEVEGDATSLSFTFKANSLPWVLPPDAALGYTLTKAGHKLSNERVRIAGLAPGKYELRIDGEPVGTWSHVTLGAKIELQSNSKTPQYKQALAVAMLNAERNAKAVRPLRNHWSGMKRQLRSKAKNPEKFAKYQVEFGKKLVELKSAVADYEDRIYQSNQPQSHRYEIVKVTGSR